MALQLPMDKQVARIDYICAGMALPLDEINMVKTAEEASTV